MEKLKKGSQKKQKISSNTKVCRLFLIVVIRCEREEKHWSGLYNKNTQNHYPGLLVCST
jgi:hypothetical protein